MACSAIPFKAMPGVVKRPLEVSPLLTAHQVYTKVIYKLRNARLDALNESPPSFLASSALPIANQDFADAKSEATLRELHIYMVQKHNLLTRVIAARRLITSISTRKVMTMVIR